MTKKEKLKKYLEKNVDFEALQNDKDSHSFTKEMTSAEFSYNGIVSKYFTCKIQDEAIAYAEYVYPERDTTYLALLSVQKELIIKHIH